jgi:IS605 OrfB family transposase
MVKQYLKRIDNINNAKNLTKQQKRKKERKYYLKLKNKMDEIHWKTIRYIISNYKYVIIGDLSMKDASNKKTSSLSKENKRIGLMIKFSEFRKRLEYKCLINNIKIEIIDEAYTSKVCSTCGHCKKELKGEKEYNCIPCNKKRDRDFNSATNMILLKI